MSIGRPEQIDWVHGQELAICTWLGLDPDDVANLAWRVTEESPEVRLWSPPELPPEPVAVVEFRTPPGVRPSRFTHSRSTSEESWTWWTLLLPGAELAEVLRQWQP